MLTDMKAGLATSLSIAGVLATGGAALVLNSSILDTESSTKGAPALATVVDLSASDAVAAIGGAPNANPVADVSANGVASAIEATDAGLSEPLVVEGATPNGKESTVSTTAQLSAGGAEQTGGSGSQTNAVRQAQAAVAATQTTTAPLPTTPGTVAPTPAPAPTTTVPSIVEKQFKVGDAATITLIINGNKLLVKDVAITPGSGYKVTNQMSRDGDDIRITLTSASRVLEFSARLTNGQVIAAVGTPASGNLTPPPPPRRDHDDDDEHEEREHREEREHHDEREGDEDDDD